MLLQNAKELKDSQYDLFHLIKENDENHRTVPAFYLCCGEEDYFLDANENFYNKAKELDYEITLKKAPGNHDWNFWSSNLEEAIKWL